MCTRSSGPRCPQLLLINDRQPIFFLKVSRDRESSSPSVVPAVNAAFLGQSPLNSLPLTNKIRTVGKSHVTGCGLEGPEVAAVSSQAFLPPQGVSTMDRTHRRVRGDGSVRDSGHEAEGRPVSVSREKRAVCVSPLGVTVTQGPGRLQGDKAKRAPPPPSPGGPRRSDTGWEPKQEHQPPVLLATQHPCSTQVVR